MQPISIRRWPCAADKPVVSVSKIICLVIISTHLLLYLPMHLPVRFQHVRYGLLSNAKQYDDAIPHSPTVPINLDFLPVFYLLFSNFFFSNSLTILLYLIEHI